MLWSTGILLAAVLVGGLVLAFFFPWGWFEERLKESLNDRFRPLGVDFAHMRPFLQDGPGISVEGFRLLLPGTQAGPDAFFSVDRLLLRPSLKDLARRQISFRLLLEAPVLRADPAARQARPFAAIAGALSQGFGAPGAKSEGPEGPLRPGSLSALLPLPAGFTLTGLHLEIRDGSLDATPSPVLSGVRGSLQIEADLSFRLELTKAGLRWSTVESGSFRLSAIAGADIRGRAFSLTDSRLAGTLRLEEALLERNQQTVALSEPVNLTFRFEEKPDRILSVPQMILTGPGLQIRMTGSTRLAGDIRKIDIRDLNTRVEDWQPLCALLFPETVFSGKLSLLARHIEIEPGRLALPGLRRHSFLSFRPRGLSCEGLSLHFTEGRLSRTDLAGAAVSLGGLTVHVEQRVDGWTGTAESARLEATRGKVLQFAGPVSAKAEWLDRGSARKARLAVDLTRGRLVCTNLLAKPPDVPLKLRARARILPDEIRAGKAFLGLGDTEWTLEGSVKDPGAPFLDARLASKAVSLESLAAISPALAEQAVGGRLEIRELALTGRPGAFKESALLKARVTGKDLTVRGASVKGLYAQAFYNDQELTISPVVLQPSTGMITGQFSADFSGEGRVEQGPHRPYSGTLQIDHVGLDDLLRVASPGLEGEAHGSTDVNLAFRGSGFAWPEAAAALEAKARFQVKDAALEQGESRDGDSEEGLAGRLESFLQEIDPGITAPRQDEDFPTGQERLLSANRASGWFSLENGCLCTSNLVAVYDGKAIEIQGSVDLAGRLQVEKGKLFTGGRMVPFRLDCGLGEEPCRPRPEPEETGKGAAADLSKTLRLLSEAAQGVYRDLAF